MGTLVNGIKEIFSSAKTTGTNVMLCGNDGTPDGHITMDNLASVLGGKYKLLRDVDCNNLGNGEYLLTGTLSNYPFERGMLYVYTSNDSTTIYQVADNMSGLLKSRSKGLESAGWSSWGDFTLGYPTFYKNYANIRALAEGVGIKASTANITNLNDFADGLFFGTFLADTARLYLGASHDSAGFLFACRVSSVYLIELIFLQSEGHAYLRTNWNGSWSLMRLDN